MNLARLTEATASLPAPLAVVDLDAFEANAADMTRRAHGLPIRVASKSVRCRALLQRALDGPGFTGIMAYSLPEALWLADHGCSDMLVGYPSVDIAALRRLRDDHKLARSVVIMVDSMEHLDRLPALNAGGATLQVAIDVDASLRIGPVHLGVRRSPVHTASDAGLLAAEIARRPGIELVGLMMYDAQIAGLPDSSLVVRTVKRRSAAELADRRAAVLDAVGRHARLRIVNGGGTGSLHLRSVDGQLTELAGGSGLYGPRLFDHYRSFTPRPAMYFATDVVRRPSARHATVYSGGYVASGVPGWSRVPLPTWPSGMRLLGSEAAGEVQTPLRGRPANRLRLGDRVWFRHAKAGELCERFDRIHLVRGDLVVDEVPTYRGEGRNFG